MNADLTPEAERTALEDMLRSDGWVVFQRHMAARWGAEEYERTVDAALEAKHDPVDEIAITRRIRDTFKGVRASMKWPEERVKALKDAPKETLTDRFAGLRRGPRRA